MREQELLADAVLAPARHPDVRYATLLCSSVSPWSKTGAFYYPRSGYRRLRLSSWVLTGILWYCECPLCRYPESWRGTASCTAPLRREYVYWTNPGRYYRYQYPHVTSILMSNIYPWCRYQTFYPSYRYTPRYRTRFYRWSRDTWHVTGWRFSLCVFLCPFDLNNKYILPLQSKVSYWDFFKSTECQAKLFTLGYLLFCRLHAKCKSWDVF